MSQKGFIVPIVLLILFVALLTIVAIKVTPMVQSKFKNTQGPVQVNQLNSNLVLERSIRNFDSLTIDYLPNFRDVRNVYEYKNKLIIAGYSKIIEYDPQTKTILRQSNKLIPTVNSAALIGNNLYVSSNRPTNKEDDFPPKRQIFVLDLTTGEIIKTYFENDQNRYVNLMLLAKDNQLWGSYWGGAFRMNVNNGQMVVYDYQTIKAEQGACPAGLFIEDNKLHVLSCSGFNVYNDATDTWTYRKENWDGEYASKLNKRAADFGLELPTFFAISPLVDGKYYLFADIGVYALQKDNMPKLLFKAKLDQDESLSSGKVLVTNDQKSALVIRRNDGMILKSTLRTVFSIKLISLDTGQIVDLLETTPTADQTLSSEQSSKLKEFDLENISLMEVPNGAQVISLKTNKKLMEINFETKIVSF